MNLRPYQSAASDAIFKEWQDNDSTLVVMPTGGGKTILFADVIRRVFPRRALVIAHREELIFQARDKIERVTGLKADVEMGEYQGRGRLVRRGAGGRLDHPNAVLGRGRRRANVEVRPVAVRPADH